MLELIITFFVTVFLITVALLMRRFEKRLWNSGICRISGLPWKLFDKDSSGARGYKDGVGNSTWISWGVDE